MVMKNNTLLDLPVKGVSTKILVVLLHLDTLRRVLLGLLGGISAHTHVKNMRTTTSLTTHRTLQQLLLTCPYLDGVAPSARASVHSKVTIILIPFFLAMHVTERVAPEETEAGIAGRAARATRAVPTKALQSCIVFDYAIFLECTKKCDTIKVTKHCRDFGG